MDITLQSSKDLPLRSPECYETRAGIDASYVRARHQLKSRSSIELVESPNGLGKRMVRMIVVVARYYEESPTLQHVPPAWSERW